MKIKNLFLFFFCFSLQVLKSQVDSIQYPKSVFHIEAFGIGGMGSINYERILTVQSPWMVLGRVGISTYNWRDFTNHVNPDLIIPFAFIGLFGYDHKAELGIGQSYTNVVRTNPVSWSPERISEWNANFTIGYRYQKANGGLIFRLCYTPILENYKTYWHWGGVSIGYAF